ARRSRKAASRSTTHSRSWRAATHPTATRATTTATRQPSHRRARNERVMSPSLEPLALFHPRGNGELVAHARHRLDHAVLLPQLGAQAPHVYVDRARLTHVVVAPYLAQQLFAGEHAARVLGEVRKQVELATREGEGLALVGDLVGQRVDV